jgi:hypothetical protein
MIIYNYQYIEELLLRLIGLLVSVLTDSEKKEIQDFIDVGEYGLALETLVDIVNEEDKQISSESLKLVYELAEVMQLEKTVFENKLRGHVFDD